MKNNLSIINPLMKDIGFEKDNKGWRKEYGSGIGMLTLVIELNEEKLDIKAYSNTDVMPINDFTSKFLDALSQANKDLSILKTKILEGGLDE